MNLIALHLNYCIVLFYSDKNWTILCIQRNWIHKTFTVPCENSKTVYFASLRMNYNLVFPALSKFAVKLISWIVLGSASKACCLLKSTAIIL